MFSKISNSHGLPEFRFQSHISLCFMSRSTASRLRKKEQVKNENFLCVSNISFPLIFAEKNWEQVIL